MSSRLYIAYRPVTPVPPITYEPETEDYLNHGDVSILNNGTVYFASTIWEITGAEIWAALDACVVQIKTIFGLTLGVNNLSTQFKFWYPRIGGTADAHAVDLVTGATQGSWFGGLTHDGGGTEGNGSTGYFDTGIQYSGANFSLNNQAFGVISKTNTDGAYIDFGSLAPSDTQVNMYGRLGGNLNTRLGDNGTNSTIGTSDSLGMLSISRLLSTEYKQYQDGSLLATPTTTSQAFSAINFPIAEWAANLNGAIVGYSTRKHTHFWGGLGVDATEMGDIYTALNQLETTLNR